MLSILFVWLLIGFIVSSVGYHFLGKYKNNSSYSFLVIGPFGAMLGGLIFMAFDQNGVSIASIESILLAALGASIALGIYFTILKS